MCDKKICRTMKIATGKGNIPLIVVVAIMSISAIVSLPGLAISPILSNLDSIFPRASTLEVELLESLPSLMIIPAMLLAGRWSIRGHKVVLLVVGSAIFLVSGIGCIVSRTLTELIVTSSLVGVGAGVVIPLSTGIIVDYFSDKPRIKMLGISSAVNNLTLVIATFAVGYLADIEWHYAFIVYLLPAVTLILIPTISHTPPQSSKPTEEDRCKEGVNRGVILRLMLFYFAITYGSLVVTYNTSYIATEYHLANNASGNIIALFFLAIMLPGFALNKIISLLGKWTNMWSLMTMGVGLIIMSLPHPSEVTLLLGALLTGLGYGVMQPIIYAKTASNAPPHLATMALSIVMAVNYLTIVVAPLLIDGIDRLFDTTSYSFAFMVNGVATLAIGIVAILRAPHDRVLGSDE